jgi:hypothetical protein
VSDEQECFKQVCETARHYGNLRFAMFTVFTAILGALLAVEMGKIGPLSQGRLVLGFRCASILLSFLFALAELRVTKLILFYQEQADKKFRPRFRLPLPSRHAFWRFVIPAIMLAPFLLAFVYWGIALALFPCTLTLSPLQS